MAGVMERFQLKQYQILDSDKELEREDSHSQIGKKRRGCSVAANEPQEWDLLCVFFSEQ